MAYINGKEILFSAHVSDGTMDDLNAIKKSIMTMGGTVDEFADFPAIPKAIETIPVGDSTYMLAEDTDTAYGKVILGGASKYASIDKIGGMSYCDEKTNTFKHAKVTKIKSVSKNLIDDAILAEIGMTKVGEHEYYSAQNYLYRDAQIFVNTGRISGAFTISGKLKYAEIGSTSSGIYARVVYTDGTQMELYPSNKEYNQYFNYEATTDANKTVDYIDITYGSNLVATHIKDLQIEKGATATESKPFAILDNFTIPEVVQGLDGFGLGVSAEYNSHIAYTEDGKAIYNGVCIARVFDGTENWQRIDAENMFKLEGITSILCPVKELGQSPSIMLCNHYTPRYANEQGCTYMNNTSFSFIDANYQTMGEWKMHLAKLKADGNPLTVVYALKYPTETDITNQMPNDNYIAIEAGACIEFVNDYGLAVPSAISYVREVG